MMSMTLEQQRHLVHGSKTKKVDVMRIGQDDRTHSVFGGLGLLPSVGQLLPRSDPVGQLVLHRWWGRRGEGGRGRGGVAEVTL